MLTAETNGRVSVIIPAFNSGRYLAETVNSVLAQTYGCTECIVVDDGSTDNTAAIAKGYGERIRYVYQENAERSAARNTGIAAASGQYLMFLDADDTIAPTKVAEQVAFLEQHQECAAVYSKVQFFRDDAERSHISLDRQTPAGDILGQLLYGNFIAVHSPLFRRSAIEAAGGFNPALAHNEDWDLFLRLAVSGCRFGFLDRCHAFCRMHQSNTSRDEIRMHESKWQVVSAFIQAHAHELQGRQIDIQRVLAYHEADFGKALIVHGRAAEGQRHILRACRTRFPGRGKYLLFSVAAPLLGQKLTGLLGRGRHRQLNG